MHFLRLATHSQIRFLIDEQGQALAHDGMIVHQVGLFLPAGELPVDLFGGRIAIIVTFFALALALS